MTIVAGGRDALVPPSPSGSPAVGGGGDQQGAFGDEVNEVAQPIAVGTQCVDDPLDFPAVPRRQDPAGRVGQHLADDIAGDLFFPFQQQQLQTGDVSDRAAIRQS